MSLTRFLLLLPSLLLLLLCVSNVQTKSFSCCGKRSQMQQPQTPCRILGACRSCYRGIPTLNWWWDRLARWLA
jgi:hypothetical protein